MSRPVRVLLLSSASIAVAAFAAACGSERISVPRSDPAYSGAVLFSQRCSGCHTLSYAATHGSAANPRMPTELTGPNFNIRCERPLTRVLYAIENGGFSGAHMPQNVVVGQDASEVAQFVSKYAGRQAPKIPNTPVCSSQSVGPVPPPPKTIATASKTTATSSKKTTAPAPRSGRAPQRKAKPARKTQGSGKTKGLGKPKGSGKPKSSGKPKAAGTKTNTTHH